MAKLEKKSGYDITAYDLGVRADTTELIARRWRSECNARLTQEYRCGIVFSFGTNDIAMEEDKLRVSVEQSIVNARDIVAEARGWLPTLWVSPPPVNDEDMPFASLPGRDRYFSSQRIAELNKNYKKIARTLSVPYLDICTPLLTDARWLTYFRKNDGVHPRASGYMLIAKKVRDWPAWRDFLNHGADQNNK